VEQEKDWLDRLVDKISEWINSLTEKDEHSQLATPLQEGSEKET
jgi:hypothetical protein